MRKTRITIRAIVATVVGMALLCVVAPSAQAAAPERTSVKGTDVAFYDFPAGSVCPFHASVDFYRQEGSFFVFSNGVQKIAYTYFVRFKNEDTRKTRVLHEAGSIVFTPLSASVIEGVTHGRELSIFFPGDLGPGQPGAFLFIVGNAREVDEYPGPHPNPFGYTTLSFEVQSGAAENLCQTMA